MLKREGGTEDTQKVLVHYHGWNKKWDEWITDLDRFQTVAATKSNAVNDHGGCAQCLKPSIKQAHTCGISGHSKGANWPRGNEHGVRSLSAAIRPSAAAAAKVAAKASAAAASGDEDGHSDTAWTNARQSTWTAEVRSFMGLQIVAQHPAVCRRSNRKFHSNR